ncbi:MAG: CopG family transcriptional regulator [Candidatus Thermoplasmatota archaeon]|jgi:Arc/MetJ-type ribon-helix-helix transcriptional regulator|nr:CopG family transcriptional regulator [Candidatus Thermoplasmatota archaeon]MCL5963208.1 CopG family transcriptional regulator [Candidatus Thermoplasmatota archaeon]
MSDEVFDSNRDGEKCVRISIPEVVYDRIKQRIKNTGFENVSDFVTFVLRVIEDSTSNEPFSDEDEKKIKERLRSIGYID